MHELESRFVGFLGKLIEVVCHAPYLAQKRHVFGSGNLYYLGVEQGATPIVG